MESVKQRYVAKLLGCGIAGIANLLYQTIASRALGPQLFGALCFIQAHVEQLFSVGDMGFTSGFFSLLSQDNRRYSKLLPAFLLILLFIFCGGLAYILFTYTTPLHRVIWPDIDPTWMVQGFFLGFAIFMSRSAVTISDAAGIARGAEMMRVVRSVLALSLLSLLIFIDCVSIPLVLATASVSYLIFAVYCAWSGHRALGNLRPTFERQTVHSGLTSLWNFSKPLAIYTLATVGSPLFERWLLQYVGGSVQQGYFGLANQLSLPVFLLTMSIVPLFQREVAVCFGAQRIQQIRHLYLKYSSLLFLITTFICIGMFIHIRPFLHLVGATEFLAAGAAINLMMLYPIQQSHNHVCMSVLLATSRSRQYMMYGIGREAIGLCLGYLFVAPRGWLIPGLGLGALGLVLKYLIGQCINTLLVHHFNCQYMAISFFKTLREQVLVIALFGGAAFGSHYLVHISLGDQWPVVASMGVDVSLYLALSILFLGILWKVSKGRLVLSLDLLAEGLTSIRQGDSRTTLIR